MHEQYLGDSFDIVKRFWVSLLSPHAPMLAHPRFIPPRLQASFTLLTGANIFDSSSPPTTRYSLLLDPHTGVPLPDAANQRLRISHAPIQFIASLFDDSALAFVACFDQTASRQAGVSLIEQLDQKRERLLTHGLYSFYYVSHAPFPFTSPSLDTLKTMRQTMMDVGVPTETSTTVRLQTINSIK